MGDRPVAYEALSKGQYEAPSTTNLCLTILVASLMASANGAIRLYSSSSPSFKRIMVIGAMDHASIRRNFEDELSAELEGIGAGAVPSYRYIPESGKVAEARLKEAVQKRPTRMR